MTPPRRLLAALCLALLPLGPALADEGAGAPVAPVAEPGAPTAKIAVQGRYEVADGRRVLTVWGTPRERGFAHGYLLAQQIVDGVVRDFELVMNARFKALYTGLLTKVVIPRFRFEPRELEELEGLFAGVQARLPPDKLQVKALGRPFELVDLKALNTFGDWYGLGCSSLAVWGDLTKDGKLLVGRNFDFPAFDLVLKHQFVMVRAADGEHQGQVGVSYPGCIGTITGMNTDGVFVAIHDVLVKPTLSKAMRPNVARLLAVRRLLEKTRGARACRQALALARTWPTLYGNNLMVAAARVAAGQPRAAVLEYDCRADLDEGCTMRLADRATEAEEDAVCLACTNHHRCRVEPKLPAPRLKPRWRYPLLAQVGNGKRPEGKLDVAGLFGWMARAAYPRGDAVQASATSLYGAERRHGTLHQAVAEPEVGRLHVRLGRVGAHIRDIRSHLYDVPALVEGARPTPAK